MENTTSYWIVGFLTLFAVVAAGLGLYWVFMNQPPNPPPPPPPTPPGCLTPPDVREADSKDLSSASTRSSQKHDHSGHHGEHHGHNHSDHHGHKHEQNLSDIVDDMKGNDHTIPSYQRIPSDMS